MKEITIFIRNNKFFAYIFLIIIFGILASRSLFTPGFYSSHDGVSHVVRLAKFYQDLADGQLIPRWSGGLVWGLGSPVLMYYGQLPYLIGLIPKLAGASFSFSVEIVTAFSLVASGIAFFLWSKEVFGEKAALTGSLFYMWAPYRFVDIYVRGAYPENFALIFPPLILLSVQKIFNKSEKEGFALGVVSLSGIILSHNVMALFFVPIYILFAAGFYFIYKDIKRFLIAIFSIISSLLVTSFYWLPAFFEKKEVYLNNLDTSGSYLSNFVGIKQIIYSKWGWGPLGSTSPMSLQIGVAQQLFVLIGVAYVLIVLIRKNVIAKKLKRVELFHFGFFLTLLLLSIFLMTRQSQFFWDKVPLLSFVLYPWRFLAIVVFSCAALASFVVKVTKPGFVLIGLVVVLLLYTNRNYSQLVGKVYENDSYYENYQDTADIWGEYLPITANLEIIKKCRQNGCSFDKVVAAKDSNLKVIANKSNLLIASYDSQKDFVAVVNTFYFPGWNSYLDNMLSNGIKVNKNGTMDISLPKGKHELEIRLENTAFRKISLLVSLLGLISSGFYFLWLRKYLRK